MSIFRKKKPAMFDPMVPLFEWGYFRGWEPKFEFCSEMGIDEYGDFYHIQPGEGGGKRGISCGGTDKSCDGRCAMNRAIYFTRDGEPLFFFRNFYCIFRATRFVDQRKQKENLVERVMTKCIHE